MSTLGITSKEVYNFSIEMQNQISQEKEISTLLETIKQDFAEFYSEYLSPQELDSVMKAFSDVISKKTENDQIEAFQSKFKESGEEGLKKALAWGISQIGSERYWGWLNVIKAFASLVAAAITLYQAFNT